MTSASSPKGFFGSLFDYSFSSFITSRIIKILYVLITVLYSLGALIVLIFGLSHGAASAIISILIVPIAWLLYMIVARVALEVLIVIFRIGEDVHVVAHPGSTAVPSGIGPQPGFRSVSPSQAGPGSFGDGTSKTSVASPPGVSQVPSVTDRPAVDPSSGGHGFAPPQT